MSVSGPVPFSASLLVGAASEGARRDLPGPRLTLLLPLHGTVTLSCLVLFFLLPSCAALPFFIIMLIIMSSSRTASATGGIVR